MRKEKHYRLCDMTLDEFIYRNLDASHDFYERLKQRIKEYKPKTALDNYNAVLERMRKKSWSPNGR